MMKRFSAGLVSKSPFPQDSQYHHHYHQYQYQYHHHYHHQYQYHHSSFSLTRCSLFSTDVSGLNWQDPKNCPVCQHYLQGPCGSRFQQWLDCATQRHPDTYVTDCAPEFARFVACQERQTTKEISVVQPDVIQSLGTEQPQPEQPQVANKDNGIVVEEEEEDDGNDDNDDDDADPPSMELLQNEWKRLIREELADMERRLFVPVEERLLHDTSPLPPYLLPSHQFRSRAIPPSPSLSQSPTTKDFETKDRSLVVVFPSSHHLVLVYCIATVATHPPFSTTSDPSGVLVAAGGKGDLVAWKGKDHRHSPLATLAPEDHSAKGVSGQLDSESLALYIPSLPHDCEELVVSAVYEQNDDNEDSNDDDDDASSPTIVYEHVFSRPFL